MVRYRTSKLSVHKGAREKRRSQLTIIAHDQAVRGKQLVVQDVLDIALIALLVSVDEDEIELSGEVLQRLVGRTLDQLHTVVELVFVESLAASGDHLGVELQSDDFGIVLLSRLVPRQGTVASVTADLEDYFKSVRS